MNEELIKNCDYEWDGDVAYCSKHAKELGVKPNIEGNNDVESK